jgi:hypothetical protein
MIVLLYNSLATMIHLTSSQDEGCENASASHSAHTACMVAQELAVHKQAAHRCLCFAFAYALCRWLCRYAGIYLQRDGGRRDGCATFWRTSLLQPALVRQLRYSQYDLKDNVALLVLFEPHSMRTPAAAGAESSKEGPLLQQQVQPQLLSPQLQQQELQEQQEQQQHKQDLLSQWLPRSWRNSSSGSGGGGSQHHQQHSKLHLRPAPQLHGSSSSGVGGMHPLYQLPADIQAQRSRSWAGSGPNMNSSDSSSPGERGSSKSSSKSGRLGRLGSRSKSSRTSTSAAAGFMNAAAAAGGGGVVEQLQVAPDWQRCGLLVANTHIIFTPDKGEVKLGQVRELHDVVRRLTEDLGAAVCCLFAVC